MPQGERGDFGGWGEGAAAGMGQGVNSRRSSSNFGTSPCRFRNRRGRQDGWDKKRPCRQKRRCTAQVVECRPHGLLSGERGGELPFGSNDIKVTAGTHQMDDDRARKILAYGVTTFLGNTYLGAGPGRALEGVEFDRRVEAMFGLIGLLAAELAGEDTMSRRRTHACGEDLAPLVKIRYFFSSNRQLVASDRFMRAFPAAFDVDFGERVRKLAEEGMKLRRD